MTNKNTSFPSTSLFEIWWTELKGVFKDQGILLFFFVVPLAYPLLYSWIYNNEVVRDVPVAVVDMSHSSSSRTYINKVDASPDVKVAYYCNNLKEAQDLIGEQVIRGIIYIPEQFDQRLYRDEQAHISVYCDMSLMLTYKAIYQTTQSVALEMGTAMLKHKTLSYTERDEEVNTEPLVVEAQPIFNTTGGYGNAILPGVLILILQQTLLLGIGLSAGTAREKGLFPIGTYRTGILKVITARSLMFLLVYLVMAAYVLLAVPRFFSFTMLAHPFELLALILPYLLAVIFFGMTLSCLVRYRENVMLLVVFTSIPFLFLSGASWPQTNIPSIWQGISWLIPSTFGIRGYLSLASMGASLSDIYPELRALWAQAICYLLATIIIYKLHSRKQCEVEEEKS